MALIPPDVGIRMRMQTEANLLQPVTPAHETPSDLPDLQPGRTFTARIQEALPENTYRALVAGKSITLSLPEGAKTGDQMELVVVDRSAKSIIARQVQAEPAATQTGGAQPYQFTRLSPAAQLIGQLLPAEGESAPPAQLNRGQPLMSEPPASRAAAIQLAPTLAKAVSQSGLFYEAHQAQWVNGKLPLAQLLQEPQGQHSTTTAFQTAAQQPNQPNTTTLLPPAATPAAAQNPPQGESPAEAAQFGRNPTAEASRLAAPAPTQPNAASLLQTHLGGNEKVGSDETATHAGQPTQTSLQPQKMPEELRPLVQQQLEAVATQRVFWHGEIWPQQSIDWEIEWERQGEDQTSADEDSLWRTALSLTTPRLGRVDATLQLTVAGVRVSLATSDDTSAVDLRNEGPKLADALATAGVPLLAFQVKHENGIPVSVAPQVVPEPE